MKKLLAATFVALLMAGCEGEEEVLYPNGQKQFEYYEKFSWEEKSTVYHGPWKSWYPNGQKARHITYKDGKREGAFTTWHENGQKIEEGTFKDDKRDGAYTEWHENGQKKSEGTFRDGQMVGLWILYNEDGTERSRAASHQQSAEEPLPLEGGTDTDSDSGRSSPSP